MRSLHLILALYIFLAVVTSVRVPLGESPDELDHFLYIEHLVQENMLPVMSPIFEENVTLEANQPPLYYLMGALLTNWLDWESSSDLPLNSCFDRNQAFRPTQYLHSSAENWRGGWLAFRLVRLLSIALGACTIWLAFRTAHLLEPTIATLAAALLAFNPQFIFITASVNNDVLTTLLGAAIVYVAVRQYRTANTDYLKLGFLFALAAATKLGLLAFGLIVVWLLWGDFGRKTPRYLLQLALPPLVIAGWWYLRNIQLYGDPLVWSVHLQAKGVYVSRTAPLQLGDLGDFVIIHMQSYFAWFGWLNIQPPNWVYLAFASVVIAAMIGCIIGWRTLFTRRWIPVLLAILGTYIALLRYIQTINWSGYQGRLAFAAAAPIAILLAFGLNQLAQIVFRGLPSNPHPLAPSPRGNGTTGQDEPLVSSLSAGESGFDLRSAKRVRAYIIPSAWTIWGAFVLISTLWFAFEDVPVVLASGTESCTVIADTWELERFAATPITAGDATGHLTIEGYGTVTSALLPVSVRNSSGTVIGDGDLTLNVTGRHIAGQADLRLDAATEPSRATLFVAELPVGSLKIGQPPQPEPNPQVVTDVVFGEQIRLIGYDLTDSELILYWEAVGEISADFTRFIHLLDANDQMIYQDDAAPSYPTGIWDKGEFVTSQLTIPNTNFAKIAVGWYQPQPFENLLLQDGSGRYILP